LSQSERIRYTVTGYNLTEISRGKGSVEYQLTDDFGNERTVTAMAKFNLLNKITRVRPIYHREFPLIQALAHTNLNQSEIVDFSEYNKKHPRGSMRKQRISVPSVSVRPSGFSVINSIVTLSDNNLRLFKLTLASVACFGVLSYFLF